MLGTKIKFTKCTLCGDEFDYYEMGDVEPSECAVCFSLEEAHTDYSEAGFDED